MTQQDDDNRGNAITEKKSVITFTCSRAEKALFVKAAKGGKLVEWIMRVLMSEVNKR